MTTERAPRLLDIDPDLLSAAWLRGWLTLNDEDRERVMAYAEEHGGVPNRLGLEDGMVVVTMADVVVLRCPLAALLPGRPALN
ncbi:MAG: hypothetical protein KF809_04135 [Chloroflexi bacterium]|nr:hypothetical protein [Chloroflexota bacterium]